MSSNYDYFQKFVLRSPKFSLQLAFDLLEQNEFVWEELMGAVSFKEALYIASPELTKTLENYHNLERAKQFKLELSLFKYFIRAASRCTPFGLFSSCSIGTIGAETHIRQMQGIKRYTNLDMNVLIEISERLNKVDIFKQAFKFYPNSTFYKLGTNFRYIKSYDDDTIKKYKLEHITYNVYLEKLMVFSIEGRTITEMVDFIHDLSKIANDHLNADTITNFIEGLIKNELLISETSLSITGGDYVEKLIHDVERIQLEHPFKETLRSIRATLKTLDANETNTISDYEQLIRLINIILPTRKYPYYFQIDQFLQFKKHTLSTRLPLKILKGIEVLSKLSSTKGEPSLTDFKNAFLERYGFREVPLSLLFDQEVGLTFQDNQTFNEFDLIPDFELGKPKHVYFFRNESNCLKIVTI